MRYKRIVVLSLVVVFSFSVGFITNVYDNYFEISKNLDIFGKLYREINALYVDDTNPTDLMRTGIDAMLQSLDPYTNYIPEEEVEDFKFMSTGQYGGIGAIIGKRNGKFIVLEPYQGYPADNMGIRAGDEILSINGAKVNPLTMEVLEVRNMLRGEKGTSISMNVIRGGEQKSIKFNLERDRIKVSNVPYYGLVDGKIGYIALAGFTQDAGKQVAGALTTLKSEVSGLKGVILDLRGNPGGRLDEAVKVTNVFVSQKEKIVETRGRLDGTQRVHYAQRIPLDTILPLAVLVNSRSASASEIVAGALQDLDRGIIVGQRSFGKGLVQNIRPLSYNTQLKVTTAKYYTPSGRCIQAINYGEKDINGVSLRIPDSLRTAFSTRNGRTVYDGGGIEPDVEIEREEISAIAIELDRQGLIFDFATLYHEQNPAPENLKGFSISDEVYENFIAFVQNHEFSFRTKADRQLALLKSTIEEEAYLDHVSAELETLNGQLKRQKNKDLRKYKTQIIKKLREEILQRYFYRGGAIEGMLSDDNTVRTAIKSLQNASEYNRMLAGSGE